LCCGKASLFIEFSQSRQDDKTGPMSYQLFYSAQENKKLQT